MKRLHLTTDGFTAIEFLLVIIALVIIGISGFFVAKHLDNKTTASTPKSINKSPPVSIPVVSEYDAAKIQWEADVLVVSSASQNPPLDIAIHDLQIGLSTDTGNKSGYPKAIADITAYKDLPITGVTPQQNAEFNDYTTSINSFFNLPPNGLNSVLCNNTGPPSSSAFNAWGSEPKNITSGVNAKQLALAASDLQQGISSNAGDKTCYQAAIADLQSLEAASYADIANSPTNIYGDYIRYLGEFFSLQNNSDKYSYVLSNGTD